MTKKTLKISLRVVLLFLAAILLNFISDYFHSFFGDWKCSGSGELVDSFHFKRCNYAQCRYHEPQYHWGFRHWIYSTMCVVLFIIQAFEIIIFAEKETN